MLVSLRNFTQIKVSRFNFDRVRRLILYRPVAAAAGWAGVTDEPHRHGVRSMLSQMVCGAGGWLRAIALKFRCAGEHVRVSTNLLIDKTMHM